tara:strand:+ start:524 stop:904 length:381 start_codon:yes stop_codon:yes gene_type:complete
MWIGGVTLVNNSQDCFNDKNLMGEYLVGKDTIVLCDDNIEQSRQSMGRVLRHEYIHYIYDRDQRQTPILGENNLNKFVREMDSSEVMFVLISEDEDSVNEEFEARILSDLPSVLLFFLDAFLMIFH